MLWLGYNSSKSSLYVSFGAPTYVQYCMCAYETEKKEKEGLGTNKKVPFPLNLVSVEFRPHSWDEQLHCFSNIRWSWHQQFWVWLLDSWTGSGWWGGQASWMDPHGLRDLPFLCLLPGDHTQWHPHRFIRYQICGKSKFSNSRGQKL